MSLSNTTYSKGMSGIYISETVRLQRETDQFTKKLEHEKRQLMVIEDQIKQALAEIEEKKGKIKAIKPSTEELRKRNAYINNKQKAIRNEELKLNETNAKNQSLKWEIDVHRKEIMSTAKQIQKYNKKITKTMRNAKMTNSEYIKDKKKAEETNDQILALKAKHEEEKNRFEKEIRSLQQRLNEKDHTEEAKDKSVNTTVDHKFTAEATTGGPKTEFSNPISILKMRLNKLISTNKEKKKLVDQYIRNVKLIEDAFEQIKESTGISNIDEIVTTFIKAEEQNYSLLNYVNRLGQETDQLEETNKKIKQDIESFKRNEELDEIEREKHIQDMKRDTVNMKDQIEHSGKEKDEFKEQLKVIQSHVEKMVRLFKKSKFMLAVANKMSYEEGTTFNETNVIQYLAELEEYISSLITYAAFKREEPFAAISAIPFEKLNKKDFEKTKLNVDAPTSTHIEGEQKEVKEGREDEAIVNSKELYKKFLHLVESQKLVFMSRSTVKQPVEPHFTKSGDS